MKNIIRILSVVFVLTLVGFSLSSFDEKEKAEKLRIKFPYKQAGLTERQAAAHLVSRFTFGATPGELDAVVDMGLEKWLAHQLKADLPDDSLNQLLSTYDALKMTNTEVVDIFPRGPKVQRMAIKEGFIDKDSVDKGDRKKYQEQLAAFRAQKGYRLEQELYQQFMSQKILRAAYSNNQLQELLTDFWFNHFNVSIVKNDCAQFIPAYERDVIRANVFGKFEDLLVATAKSPAMLLYLDNFTSSGYNDEMKKPGNDVARKRLEAMMADTGNVQNAKALQRLQQAKKAAGGLNENYAREVMELHTLGVDGGYTQQDVTQAAKVLTGWTIYPISDYGPGSNMKTQIEKIGPDKLAERGFVHDGDFLFAGSRHDNGEKTVLGKKFPAGGGYEEGVELLDMLAHHSSTAKFICKKIATRFVNDNPPQSLIDKMVKTFTEKDGDITQTLVTMVASPEFWSKEALREKTKSPFEFAISAVRSLDANITQPAQLNNWITRMGERLYYYQAPTGFPDKGQYWINSGSLLNRMNFGLALVSKRIPGITIDLAALNNGHEPESANAALAAYAKIILPERNLDETIKRLTPLLKDPDLEKKVIAAATKTPPPPQNMAGENMGSNDNMMMSGGETVKEKPLAERVNKKGMAVNTKKPNAFGDNSMLTQVVGIIIGSPEFQRK